MRENNLEPLKKIPDKLVNALRISFHHTTNLSDLQETSYQQRAAKALQNFALNCRRNIFVLLLEGYTPTHP